jgi:hypothetical protein
MERIQEKKVEVGQDKEVGLPHDYFYRSEKVREQRDLGTEGSASIDNELYLEDVRTFSDEN